MYIHIYTHIYILEPSARSARALGLALVGRALVGPLGPCGPPAPLWVLGIAPAAANLGKTRACVLI